MGLPLIKLILTSLLYNYCAMFVLADRGMHVLHIDVLKNDSIVGYVVFDFDLLLSDDNGFQYSTNYHSNSKDKDQKTKTKHNKQHQTTPISYSCRYLRLFTIF